MKWWENYPWRLVQTNLSELDFKGMDPEQYVEDLKEFEAPIPELPKWEEFYQNFVAVVEGREKLLITHEENRIVMKVLDACFRSMSSGKVEKVDDLGR